VKTFADSRRMANALLLAALPAVVAFMVPSCSSPDRSDGASDAANDGTADGAMYICPRDMPTTGDSCDIAAQSSVPGAVPVCGYLTSFSNPCNGSVDCYCEHGAWLCGPTCVSEGGQSVGDAGGPDASVEASGEAGLSDSHE
jgi:hypothetical protein